MLKSVWLVLFVIAKININLLRNSNKNIYIMDTLMPQFQTGHYIFTEFDSKSSSNKSNSYLYSYIYPWFEQTNVYTEYSTQHLI